MLKNRSKFVGETLRSIDNQGDFFILKSNSFYAIFIKIILWLRSQDRHSVIFSLLFSFFIFFFRVSILTSWEILCGWKWTIKIFYTKFAIDSEWRNLVRFFSFNNKGYQVMDRRKLLIVQWSSVSLLIPGDFKYFWIRKICCLVKHLSKKIKRTK